MKSKGTLKAVESKFEEIAEDLTYNVTHIYDRYELIYVTDLVYHSILSFYLRGEYISKGCVEAVVLGDTRVGKSETGKQLLTHYRAGEFITGEQMSYAGLIGGLQQMNNRWMITWGKVPLQTRRLVILDEVNNIPLETIASMSGIRSSGVAELTKIQSYRTEARTRMLWLGNPRGNRFLGNFSLGILGVKSLIGNLDDIARFDIALTCAENEVNPDMFYTHKHKEVEHKFTSDCCHNLILWAWSRTPEQVEFVNDSDLAILDFAKQLGEEYTSQIPLVNPSEMRIKLAKLSVATAARVFSTDETCQKVIVQPEHVEFVVKLLHSLYNKPSMGYDIYTKINKEEHIITNEDKIIQYIANRGAPFLDGLLNYEYIGLSDFMDLTGDDRDMSKSHVSFFVQNRCIKKVLNNYVKSPAFNNLLRRMKVENIVSNDTTPTLTLDGDELCG